MISVFKLNHNFIKRYSKRPAPFGWKTGPNTLGEIVCMRTYSRVIAEYGVNEQWYQICERVVNGVYRMLERHVRSLNLEWNEYQAQEHAQEMYDRMFNMKWLPPGRGLWSMGTDITEHRHQHAALFNCSFVSTKHIDSERWRPFCFAMDALMLGIGVGFDVKGANLIKIKRPKGSTVYATIGDSREGWVESLKLLLSSYFEGTNPVKFNYELIRKEGLPIKGFGGKASGPEPLKKLHEQIRKVMDDRAGHTLSARDIVDVMNMVGCCVVAGNIRRSAEIALGKHDDIVFTNLKNYEMFPERAEYGWTSNNTVYADLGMDYKPLCERIITNGEPGFIWLENIRKYGRIVDGFNTTDIKVEGVNPCSEIGLESYELCNLCEIFPYRHSNLQDFARTIKCAYLYSKIITLSSTQWTDSNRVMLRNRRIGVSLSGIQQFIATHGIDTFKHWCFAGYAEIRQWDKVYSDWLCIPRSIKTTTVKPSGTVSLLSGATPGMHWPTFNHHIRRIRVAEGSEMAKLLEKAGYHCETAINESKTIVVEIPVEPEIIVRTENEISMWEQLEMVAFLQHYWADNQVSSTVKFNKDLEGKHLATSLNYYQYHLKGISFLPYTTDGKKPYPQMPYEAISEHEYQMRVKGIKKIDFKSATVKEGGTDRYCSNDTCQVGG